MSRSKCNSSSYRSFEMYLKFMSGMWSSAQSSRSFGSKNLVRVRPQQARLCSHPFQSSAKSITCTFAMGRSKEVPLSSDSKVFLMKGEVQEILTIFVLCWGAVREINHFMQFSSRKSLLRTPIRYFWKRWTATVSWRRQSEMITKFPCCKELEAESRK